MFADQTTIPLIALYRTGTDPATTYTDGRITPGIMWLDTSTGATGTLKKRNEANSGWDTLINLDSPAVPNDSVTNAILANMAQATIKGRASGAGTGDPTDLTGTQATAILDAVVGDSGSGGTKGLVPAPGAGDAAAGKFLKADGTFAVPPGTGGGLTADGLSAPVYAADGGSTDAYAITLSPVPSGYTAGTHYRFKANTSNTGACTLNVNSLGAKTIKKVAGGITTDLADNDIRGGQFVEVVYDGTNFQIQSTLGNAAAGTTINTSDNRIPVRSNATTFIDSYLIHNVGSTRTESLQHFVLDTGKIIGFGDAALARKNVGVLRVVSDTAFAPASIISETNILAFPGGTPTPWASSGMNFRYVANGNFTLGNPGGGASDGYRFTLMIVQDATGSRIITWSSAYKFAGGTVPTLTTTANAVDIFEFLYYSSTAYCIGQFLDVK